MPGPSRRHLLQAAVAGGFATIAGCLGDDDGNGESMPTPTPATGGVGDQLFAEWLPAPLDSDEVNQQWFLYTDIEHILSLSDVLPEEATESFGTTELQWGDGTISQQLSATSLYQNPDQNRVNPVTIIRGEYDQASMIDAFESEESDSIDSQTDIDEFTVFIQEPSDTNSAGSLAIGPSVLMFIAHTVENEGTESVEAIIDAGAGEGERLHQADDSLAQLMAELEGVAFADFGYAPEGPQSQSYAQGYVLDETEVTRRIALLFDSEGAVDEELTDEMTTGLEEDGFADVTSNQDGTLVRIEGSKPTDELQMFDSFS